MPFLERGIPSGPMAIEAILLRCFFTLDEEEFCMDIIVG